ncbi:MAG: hypothetical protein WB709_10040 [Solirubrobacteraceae bacterium]
MPTVCAALAFVALSIVFLGSPAAVLAAPTVTVRVEGASSTLLGRTTVTLNVPEPVSGCPANSVAAAINLAVAGNWDHGEAGGSGGDFTQTILGETHAFTHEGDTWAEWVNYKWGGGICTDLLSEGDEVLMIADHEPEPTFAPTVWPLVVTGAPSSVQVGVPFTVRVSEIRTPAGTFAEPGQGTPTPVAGATVSGTGVVGGISDASGMVTVTLSSSGSFTLRASKGGDAPSATFIVCAHNGNDGTCGTQTAPGSSGSQSSAAGMSNGAPYKGPYALVPHLSSLMEGHAYTHAHAPRVLSGSVLAHTTISSISLTLRRSYRHRCYAFDGISTRFVRARCGTGKPFKVSDNGLFSYLLPSALAPGRYVLDIQATDIAGNRTTLARGTSRVVFYVR